MAGIEASDLGLSWGLHWIGNYEYSLVLYNFGRSHLDKWIVAYSFLGYDYFVLGPFCLLFLPSWIESWQMQLEILEYSLLVRESNLSFLV